MHSLRIGNRCLRALIYFSVSLAACGGETTPPPVGTMDLGTTDIGVVDTGTAVDAAFLCIADGDCDDGVFCNGVARCAPMDPLADARGCLPMGVSECIAGTTCDEALRMCLSMCDVDSDADGDSSIAASCGGDDCDDSDAARYPGATEICDLGGRDEDCNPTTLGPDGDGDGFTSTTCCYRQESGTLDCGSDCDDASMDISPTAPEVCDGLDDDCDGRIDEDVTLTFYRDVDADLYGVTTMTRQACSAPMGYTLLPGDCNDATLAVHPGVTDICNAGIDDDCDGTPDPGCMCTTGTTLPCGTGDGAGGFLSVGTCVPGEQTCAGGAWGACIGNIDPVAESCNGTDDDCDGMTDEGVTNPYYQDLDGDGHGNLLVVMQACAAPLGHVVLSDDCDDALASVRPGALETCNMVDDNCNGSVDEGVQTTFYWDGDGDGFGQSAMIALACAAPGGYVAVGGDCDDGSAVVYPLAPESCANAIDDNCNGTINEGCSCTLGQTQTCGTPDPAMPMQFLTAGVCRTGTQMCSSSGQWQMCAGNVAPSAEVCNALDDDCDTIVDEGTRVSCYPDADDDAYAAPGAISSLQCRSESRAAVGYCPSMFTNRAPGSVPTTDCNDGNASINPTIAEMCSVPAVDQNCNGNADEGYVVCYADADGDGYTIVGVMMLASACPVMGGYGGCGTGYTSRNPMLGGNVDCDPADATQNPGAAEVCDSRFEDDNCDTQVDEGFLATRTYYRDNDSDGYGGTTSTTAQVASCRPATYVPPTLSGYVLTNTDCCDTSSWVYPGQRDYFTSPSACGTFDYDCSGAATGRVSLDGRSCSCSTTVCAVKYAGATPDPPECYTGATPACGASVPRCACPAAIDCTSCGLASAGATTTVHRCH